VGDGHTVEIKRASELTAAEKALVSPELEQRLNPITVPPQRLVQALAELGHFETFMGALNAGNPTVAAYTNLVFMTTNMVSQDDPFVLQTAAAVGWTDAEVDALFIRAKEIERTGPNNALIMANLGG